jgi:peptidoglycan hydrolase-like protein with peptidoglycan-binding domain
MNHERRPASGSPSSPRLVSRGSDAVRLVVVLTAVLALVTMLVADRLSGSSGTASSASAGAGEGALGAATTVAATPAGSTPTTAAAAEDRELDATTAVSLENCTLDATLRMGSSGPSVSCLQKALADAGAFSGPPTGEFGGDTFAAVEAIQKQRNLFVDGVVGRETAISLGVWPDEQSFVVRTAPPPKGAKDSMGFLLSSVSSTGANAPPLPANSGSGKRVVYERRGQRVWAVGKNNQVIRSWLVTGSQYNNEAPGTHKVYSRSEVSTAWNGKARLPLMIRYYRTKIGAIGFHGIPTRIADGSAYQTEAELGTRLSGGCQRQANRDAAFLWAFAQVGTPVVVL